MQSAYSMSMRTIRDFILRGSYYREKYSSPEETSEYSLREPAYQYQNTLKLNSNIFVFKLRWPAFLTASIVIQYTLFKQIFSVMAQSYSRNDPFNLSATIGVCYLFLMFFQAEQSSAMLGH